jgi:hypothetical protein
MMLGLGITQILAFVIGLPALVLFLLHRNKNMDGGGLGKHATLVRYGLFYGAYKDNTYYWEVVLTGRKIGIVALSVFGPGMGTERQAQMALALLLICISLEIAGDPFRLNNDRFRILGRLEIATLFVQWATMWCGSMIFASQDRESEGFVMFLTIMVVIMNIGMLFWLVLKLLMECVHEKREESAQKAAENKTTTTNSAFQDRLSTISNSVERWRFGRLTSEEQQRRLRSRTVESSDSKNVDNPSRTSVIESHVSEPEATSTTANLELTNLSLNSKKSSSRSFGSRKLKKKIGRRKKNQSQPDQSTLNSPTQKSRKETINRLAMRQKQMNWKTNELNIDPFKTDQVEHRSIETDEVSGNLYYYDPVANISTWFTEVESAEYRSS